MFTSTLHAQAEFKQYQQDVLKINSCAREDTADLVCQIETSYFRLIFTLFYYPLQMLKPSFYVVLGIE